MICLIDATTGTPNHSTAALDEESGGFCPRPQSGLKEQGHKPGALIGLMHPAVDVGLSSSGSETVDDESRIRTG